MRREQLYLTDIVDAADAIKRFIDGVDEDAFNRSDLLQSAVLQKLAVIGEAVSRLPEDLRHRYPSIPWRRIVAFRNIAVHAYFSVDWSIVWVAATQDTPDLRREVASILAREFPSPA